MSTSRRLVAWPVLAAWLALAGCQGVTTIDDPGTDTVIAAPELLLEGPDSLSAAAESVRRVAPARLVAVMRMVGLEEPGAPIRVLVLPEDSAAASDVPAWVAGYADGDHSLIVLFPERSLAYPDATFDGLVVHEVAHILIRRAAAGRSLPRWFHEGLATAAGSWGIGDRTRVTVAMLLGSDRSLAALERAFASDDARRTGRAYALSEAFARDVLARERRGAVARILAARAGGMRFEDAFAAGTGASLALAEQAFWARHTRWYRWVPLLASSTVLWTGIVVLAFWARRRRRERADEIQRRWQEQEPGSPVASGSGGDTVH